MKKYLSVVLAVFFVAIALWLVLFDMDVLTENPNQTNTSQATHKNEGSTDRPFVGEAITQNTSGLPEGNYSRGLSYTLSDRKTEYYITGIGSCKDTDIIISPTYRGKPVVGITDMAFKNNDTIESISVIHDADAANSLFFIGYRAFYSCQKLKKVEIAARTLSLPSQVFANCPRLEEVDISQTTIYSIGTGAFEKCTSLKSVRIPPTASQISDAVFIYCTSLESITLPKQIIKLGENVFLGCTSLKSVVMPENLKKIPKGTFSGCISLTDVTIPDTVTTIFDSAFHGCIALKSLSIPKKASQIAQNAFTGCVKLTDISISSENEHFYVEDGKLISKSDGKIIFEQSQNPKGSN